MRVVKSARQRTKAEEYKHGKLKGLSEEYLIAVRHLSRLTGGWNRGNGLVPSSYCGIETYGDDSTLRLCVYRVRAWGVPPVVPEVGIASKLALTLLRGPRLPVVTVSLILSVVFE
jgi:hypothetical protein